MTNNERIEKMAVLKAQAEESVQKYNDLLQNEKLSEAEKVYEDLTKTINEYTSLASVVCFENCKATGDPMLAAVTTYSFQTIAVKGETRGEGDTAFEVFSIVPKAKQIDLLRLHKYCGSIGKDKNWVYMVEKLNMLMTAQKAMLLGLDPKKVRDCYYMNDISRDINLGKTPTSNTSILKTLQLIVNAMIGEEYKAVSHDVNYLKSVYSKKGKAALTVVCANHKYMRGYIMDICHRIVTGASYGLDYKMNK